MLDDCEVRHNWHNWHHWWSQIVGSYPPHLTSPLEGGRDEIGEEGAVFGGISAAERGYDGICEV